MYFTHELSNDKIIRFIYQGRELKDSETLHQCNIHDQTVIHCQINTRQISTVNQLNDQISSSSYINENHYDSLLFYDRSSMNISSYFILILTCTLGFTWYLRIKYCIGFSPVSTSILLLITIIFLIFLCDFLLLQRRSISNTRISSYVQHIHLD